MSMRPLAILTTLEWNSNELIDRSLLTLLQMLQMNARFHFRFFCQMK